MSARQCILLVDDSENDLALAEVAFRRAGFTNRLQMVRDGEEAIAYLGGNGDYRDRTQFPLPSVVLLDLKMPRKSGFDVLKWLREQPGLGRIPVIVLTASMEIEDVKRAHELGASSFLVKPTALGELTAMMRCMREWLQYNHLPPHNESVRS
jgi:CheY-like chemotaxis protein